jgi:hypothetical protein
MTESEDKRNARAHGWERLATHYPYSQPRLRVREDRVRWPDGHESLFAYVQAFGAVWIVPMTAEGTLLQGW